MKNNRIKVGVLGCTGSIGRQTLEVIDSLGDAAEVVLLACQSNKELLSQQIQRFRPKIAICNDYNNIIGGNGSRLRVYDTDALRNPDIYEDCDIVVNGIGGLAGLAPTLAVLDSPAALATANKESLVAAGSIVMAAAKDKNKTIMPIDSEHSAVWQCLEDKASIEKLILTASGGAFRDYSRQQLSCARAADALKHPTWVMGKKVTIDSATLFNKCMEVVEARRLFGIDNIEVVIHRQSIIHALVGFCDGSLKASLSYPDMRLPIQYALTGAKRQYFGLKSLDLAQIGTLSFEAPDISRFPCLGFADYLDSDYKGSVACAADELLVNLYLDDKITFYDIPKYIESALSHFGCQPISDIAHINGIEKEVKEYTLECLYKHGGN